MSIGNHCCKSHGSFCRERGFTLIELLVVISIIALLLAILMPALGKVKEKGRSVVCRSNLHSWVLSFALYNADNNDSYHQGWGGSASMSEWWMLKLRPYYGDVDMIRCCPIATKTEREIDGTTEGPGFGQHFTRAWGYHPNFFGSDDFGSYGINGWILNRSRAQEENLGMNPQMKTWFWRKSNAAIGASQIPIILDSQWIDGWPQHQDNPPPRENMR